MTLGNETLKSNRNFEGFTLLNFINLNPEEKEMVREWRNQENVREWMFTDHTISKEEHHGFIESLKREGSKHYCWVLKKDEEYLGVVSLNKVDFKNSNTFFGLYANPFSKKLGVSIYLFKAAIHLAFSVFGLHSIRGDTIAGNPILYMHKKFGFLVEGTLKDFVKKETGWKDVVITAMINPQDKGELQND